MTRSLAVLIGTGSFSATAGSSLTVPFAASLPAIVTLELRKGNRIVVRTQASVRAGRGKLKIAHLPKAAGRYTVRLTAFAADGETASDHVALTVRAKAKKKPAKQPSGNGNGNGPAVGGGGTS